jgi:hypothetical protein
MSEYFYEVCMDAVWSTESWMGIFLRTWAGVSEAVGAGKETGGGKEPGCFLGFSLPVQTPNLRAKCMHGMFHY